MEDYSSSLAWITGQDVPEGVKIVVRKCGCGCTWCPSCSSKTSLREISKYISQMNYRHVRHVTLTVDRSLFHSGREAHIEGSRRLNRLMMELNRERGVIRYCWILEWHKDGFPHWHVVIEMDEKGKASQIGEKWIHGHWFPESRIHETFFKSEYDFQGFAGYFRKHGYFGEKEHQGTLPKWALAEKKIIRRFGRKQEKLKLFERERAPLLTVAKRGRVSYREVLESCGSCSEVSVQFDKVEVGRWRLDVPYAEIRGAWQGEYEFQVGYVLTESWDFVKGKILEHGTLLECEVPF